MMLSIAPVQAADRRMCTVGERARTLLTGPGMYEMRASVALTRLLFCLSRAQPVSQQTSSSNGKYAIINPLSPGKCH